MNRSPWRLKEVDGSLWRLEEVNDGDEQYPVESRFAVRHTPLDEQDPRFDISAPMNTSTTLFLSSDPAMYTSPSRTYARVGVRDPARMYVRGRIYFLAPCSLYIHPGRLVSLQR